MPVLDARVRLSLLAVHAVGVLTLARMPFALTSRAIARFDAAATAVGAALAVTVGALCAVTFRASAPWLFDLAQDHARR